MSLRSLDRFCYKLYHILMTLPKTLPQPTTAHRVQQELRSFQNLQKAKILQRFFKTGPGQYAEGDRFLGIPVPVTRKLAKKHQSLPLAEIRSLIHSCLHEERLLGLIILTLQYEQNQTPPSQKEKIFRFYLANRKFINNWDLVDVTTPQIVGAHLYPLRKSGRRLLLKLSQSHRLWDRRIAMLATFYFIRQNYFSMTLLLARSYLQDREDLIHKVSGWMLREIGKRNTKVLIDFLNQHASQMPRIMLRYSIERLSLTQKRHYLNK